MKQQISFITTERERQLLSYLFQAKVATFKQIHRDQFPNNVKSAVSKRLGRLLKSKFIKKGITDLHGKYTQIFYLNGDTVKFSSPDEVDQITRYQMQSGTIDHDIALVDLRSRLSKFSPVKKYWSENELQCLKECSTDSRLMPLILLRSDAALEIVSDGHEIVMPLELEVSRKAESRYEEKLSKYYERENISAILFIAGSEGIMNVVIKAEKKIAGSKRPKFYYALLRDVLTDRKEVEFTNLWGDKFVLQ
ncbi:MAG: hypothetical protein JWQ35_2679 [Bacteriovoracaceae bacterium]|nr:hypothetical protein [Bacteriovoracaceae bacterium]